MNIQKQEHLSGPCSSLSVLTEVTQMVTDFERENTLTNNQAYIKVKHLKVRDM